MECARQVLLLMMIGTTIAAHLATDNETSRVSCLDGGRSKLPQFFAVTTCAKCFDAVTRGDTGLIPMMYNGSVQLVSSDMGRGYAVDAFSDDSRVCREVLVDEAVCTRWRECCKSAERCCEEQITNQTKADHCPMVWDGVVCLPATPLGETQDTPCPKFLSTRVSVCSSEKYARTTCGADGVWVKGYEQSRFLTNVTDCMGTRLEDVLTQIEVLKTSILVNLIGYSLSTIASITSIIMFITFRNLRRDPAGQANVKIHTNLFVAVALNGIANVVWDCVIYRPSLDSMLAGEKPYYYQDTIDCKTLNFSTLYFRSVVYWCMFCEGLFLLRRLTATLSFGRPETLLKYFAVGWGVPAVFSAVYVVVRVTHDNKHCWFNTDSFYEMIVHIPNVVSLLLNFIFLCYITHTLSRLSNPSESSIVVIRRTLRATFTLVPLFGVQMVLVIYRPQCWWSYEIVANLVVSTQGLVVSLIYCFFNKEVRQEMRSKYQRYRRSRKDSRFSTRSFSSSFSKSRNSTQSTRASHSENSRPSRDEPVRSRTDSDGREDPKESHKLTSL